MRVVIQRVIEASIEINEKEIREIGQGFVVYLGVMQGDTISEADYLAQKICNLRIFSDMDDKLNLALSDIKGDILIVSNFTLSANCRKGNRPSFELAEKPLEAEKLYDYFTQKVKMFEGIKNVQTGVFGADMKITSIVDGPINIVYDTAVKSK